MCKKSHDIKEAQQSKENQLVKRTDTLEEITWYNQVTLQAC